MPLVIVEDAPAMPQGMDKVADQEIKQATANVKLTGWTARSSYVFTKIVGNELVFERAGEYSATCRITLTSVWNSTYGTLQVMLMRNDTQLTVQNFVNGTSALDIALPVDVLPGDRVWARMTNTHASYLPSATVLGGAGTYLIMDAR